jgi:hypothetical protein
MLLLLAPALTAADGAWTLVTSTLSQGGGVSHAARGTAACQAGHCDFGISVLVKSFASGNAEHDLEMMQAVRGALFPTMKVRMSAPEAGIAGTGFRCDVEVEFAGQTVKYRDVAFQVSPASMGTRISGTIPARMPVRLDMTWRPGL